MPADVGGLSIEDAVLSLPAPDSNRDDDGMPSIELLGGGAEVNDVGSSGIGRLGRSGATEEGVLEEELSARSKIGRSALPPGSGAEPGEQT